MFALIRLCNSRSTRSTGWWSCSRSGARRCRRSRPRGTCSRSGRRPRASRAASSSRSSPATAGSSGAAAASTSRAACPTRRSSRRRSSSSTSRRPGSPPPRRGSARSAPCGSRGSSWSTASRRSCGPGVPLPRPIADLTGLREEELLRAPPVGAAVRRFVAFAGDAVLVAHNARFDVSFLDRQLVRVERPPALGAGRRHGRARPLPARRPRRPGTGSPRSATSSAPPRGRATVRCPTRRRPRRSSSR